MKPDQEKTEDRGPGAQDGRATETIPDTALDTDTKLALLASLLEPATYPLEELLDALQARQGDIGRAAEDLLLPRVKSAGKRKAGTSLESWLGRKRGPSLAPNEPEHVLDIDGLSDDDKTSKKREASTKPTTTTDLMSLLRQPTSPVKPKNPPRPPIPLPSQAAINKHSLPLTILRSPISPALASALYLTMMEESETWDRNRFYLAGKWVESPHTACHYAREGRHDGTAGTDLASPERIAATGDVPGDRQNDPGGQGDLVGVKAFVDDAESLEGKNGKKATYMWSGQEISPPREYPILLKRVADLVEPIINETIQNRSRYPLEWAGEWKATICGANRYDGASSGVGWHADQMTYLGPYCTIASLSLGTPRKFRLRPTDTVDSAFAASTPTRTYEVDLGHNSLVLMNAGCQERYKHTVPTQKALDVFRPAFDVHERPIPLDEQKTYTSRINITFRFHRPDFHPLPADGPFGSREGTPYCKCGIPTLLRADQKAKARSRLPPSPVKPKASHKPKPEAGHDESDAGRPVANKASTSDTIDDDMVFFWQCQSSGQTGDMKGCGFFKILDMRREGRGPCVIDEIHRGGAVFAGQG